jgi:hypothetical protein
VLVGYDDFRDQEAGENEEELHADPAEADDRAAEERRVKEDDEQDRDAPEPVECRPVAERHDHRRRAAPLTCHAGLLANAAAHVREQNQ